MTIHERDRYQLHQALDTHLGSDNAATLMAYLPPVGWADVATKHDLHALEERLQLRIHAEGASLRTEIGELRTELRTEMAEMNGSLRTEMAKMRGEMAKTSGDLRSEFHNELRTTTIITIAANTAVVGAIATLLNLF